MGRILIQVRKIDGTSFPVEVESETTVDELKRIIGKRHHLFTSSFSS